MNNAVIWARVSSREQREGYSIDAQLRITREKAKKEGWNVVHEFVVAESAKRGAERLAFNAMMKWMKANTRKLRVGFLVSHKLDRVCRNMRDAVRLQELEDSCGVKLAFVDNQFGPGAAGALSFNVMAAVAQYYSDNLRGEVLKGLDEKVRQGWPIGHAPYGYINVPGDKDRPIKPEPQQAKSVRRIFELYATGTMTFPLIADRMTEEGYIYRKTEPRFSRTAISAILNKRLYLGELKRHGVTYEGKFEPIIERRVFDACQRLLRGKNRRTSKQGLYLAGGLFQCSCCGYSVTGEKIRRKLKGGGVNEHLYYRCGNVHPDAEHPGVRWREPVLEEAIIKDLAGMRIENQADRDWIRHSLVQAFADEHRVAEERSKRLHARAGEIRVMRDRLLDAYMKGAVEEATFSAKSLELKQEADQLERQLKETPRLNADLGQAVVQVFDFSQNAAEIWAGSISEVRRDLLHSVILNGQLSDVSLVTKKKRPFDVLVERPFLEASRSDRI